MPELPVLDSMKIANREIDRLRQNYLDSLHRESKLEVLAEALCEERDKAYEERDKAQRQLAALLTSPEDDEMSKYTIVENLQPQDTSPSEEAE